MDGCDLYRGHGRAVLSSTGGVLPAVDVPLYDGQGAPAQLAAKCTRTRSGCPVVGGRRDCRAPGESAGGDALERTDALG